MGVFGSLDAPASGEPVPATVVDDPTVRAAALEPRAWCELLDLSPESGPGSLVWRAADRTATLREMIDRVEDSAAPETDVRAACNHLRSASAWDVFDADGLDAAELCESAVTVVDVSELDSAPANAVLRAVGAALYRARVSDRVERLPWLLVDEAHAFFGGVAEPALERLLTRGRAPGVSLVLATQRPSAVSDVALSQSDLVVAHRLTAETDLDALRRAQPSYLTGSLVDRLPENTGEVLVLDDATETVHAARVRSRDTPHDGESPEARHVNIEAAERRRTRGRVAGDSPGSTSPNGHRSDDGR